MKLFRKIKKIILWPYTRIQEEIAWRKKLKEMRKRDPFIYK